MDYKAEQELEIESLQAIFADQLAGKAAKYVHAVVLGTVPWGL